MQESGKSLAKGNVYRNIRYCKEDSCDCLRQDPLNKHVLDLYLPQRSSDDSPPPLVLFVHGGGWRRGHKNGWQHYLSSYDTNLFFYLLLRILGMYDNVGLSFSRAGYACVVPAYTLSETPWYIYIVELCISLMFSLFTILCGLLLVYLPVKNSSWYSTPSTSGALGSHLEDGSIIFLLNCSILILWLLISLRVRYYTKSLVAAFWLFSGVFFFSNILSCSSSWSKLQASPQVFLFLIITSLVCLLLNYLVFTTNHKRTHQNALSDLTTALDWVLTHGRDSEGDLFDAKSIYLCGHSAGAHLAFLLLLQQDRLQTVYPSVKGFIGMSGAYDITKMEGRIAHYLYRRPVFGTEMDGQWINCSPLQLLASIETVHEYSNTRRRGSVILPPVLLITAASDFGLEKQAERLKEILIERGIVAKHVMLQGHNHFSIISLFGQSASQSILRHFVSHSRRDAWLHCVQFIKDTIINTCSTDVL